MKTEDREPNEDSPGSGVVLIMRNTSPYPTNRVESLLSFSFVDVLQSGIEVHVKGSSRSYRGRAYDGIPRMANVINPV